MGLQHGPRRILSAARGPFEGAGVQHFAGVWVTRLVHLGDIMEGVEHEQGALQFRRRQRAQLRW